MPLAQKRFIGHVRYDISRSLTCELFDKHLWKVFENVDFDPRAIVPHLGAFCRSGHIHAFFLIGIFLKTISLGFSEVFSAFTEATATSNWWSPLLVALTWQELSLHHRAAQAFI